MNKLLENSIFNILVGFLTIIALFAADFNYAIFTMEADNYFDGIFILCIVIFLIEIIASIFAKYGYVFTFFFYLDILSILTILLDLSVVNSTIFK